MKPIPRKLLIWFVIWTAIGLFFASRQLVRSGQNTFQLRGPIAVMVMWYLWGVLSVIIIAVDNWFSNAKSLGRRLLFHFPLSILITITYIFISQYLSVYILHVPVMSSTAIVRSYSNNILPIFFGAFQWNYPTYWLIAGSWLAWSYHRESQNRQFEATQLALKTSQLEQQLIESQMLNLKAQLQPHFLFNALNTISAFVEKDPRGARRMIEHLGDLLSYSLEHSEDQENSLAQELEVLNHYLAIQRVRFEDRLLVKMEIDSEAMQAVVPTLILQPLVENAMHHGAVLQSKLVCVTIAASFDNGWLNLQVRDDGLGLHHDWNFVDDAGVGLGNIQKRLNRLYPDAHRFVVTNAPEGGVIADISMPFKSMSTIDSIKRGGANGKDPHLDR